MRPQTKFLVIVSLMILFLGGAYYAYSAQKHEAPPVITATIRRDCAPWDGSAFTVSIPLEEGVIDISIYQAPEIDLPVRFLFPDPTGNTGNALLLSSEGVPEQLNGNVSFQSVVQDSAVEGVFDLHTIADRQFKGSFVAEWINQPVLCG